MTILTRSNVVPKEEKVDKNNTMSSSGSIHLSLHALQVHTIIYDELTFCLLSCLFILSRIASRIFFSFFFLRKHSFCRSIVWSKSILLNFMSKELTLLWILQTLTFSSSCHDTTTTTYYYYDSNITTASFFLSISYFFWGDGRWIGLDCYLF